MNSAYETLKRLGVKVSKDERVLCLLGLGSMSETARMDEFSDMDFFLIVAKGAKASFIDNLDWLSVCPIVYSFRNTPDGYKAMFDNGVFAEFAVFEPDELAHIGFTEGNVIFARPGFDLDIITPRNAPKKETVDVNYLVNEAATNLLIGIMRERRGEKAAAFMMIQVHAAANIMRLFEVVFKARHAGDDPYVIDRRIESKYAESKDMLAGLRQGYGRNVESAAYALSFLADHFEINASLKRAIEKYIHMA